MRLAASLCLFAPTATQAQDCATVLANLTYPRLARITEISGTVQAAFAVETSGTVASLETQGHPFLVHELASHIKATNFPAHCRDKRLQFTVDFRLTGEPADKARTTVAFPSPGHIEITSNPTGIICAMNVQTAPPRSRLRRFLRALAAPIQ